MVMEALNKSLRLAYHLNSQRQLGAKTCSALPYTVARHPDYDSRMTSSIYAARRAHLAAHLAAEAAAIIPTAPQRVRSRDTNHPYRHDSYFYYLTGFSEPDATLLLHADGRSALFCQPKDREREIWDGLRLGPQAAVTALDVGQAFSSADIDSELPRLIEGCTRLYYPFATHEGLALRIEGWLTQARARQRLGAPSLVEQADLCLLLDEMRLIKDAHEQTIMRRAAGISAQAHVRAMQRSARMLRAGEDVREYHLEAELLHEFRQHGAQAAAYGSIVAAGANACILHYQAGNAPVCAGELVLIDAGCELNGYASDITRTFPANGTFSAAQRQLYDLVLAAQEAAIAAIRAGASFDAPHQACLHVFAQGLLDLGLLDKNRHGNAQDVLQAQAYTPFYMHRTSHWLGMDVHDCGSYGETGPATGQRGSRTLQAGMCLTIEPGLYVRPAADVPERFHHIGIRIEDDAIVTANGCELTTRAVPVQPDAIEALMRA